MSVAVSVHQGAWRVAAPLQLAYTAYRLFAHVFHTFTTDRQTEGHTSQLGYTLHLSPPQVVDAKNDRVSKLTYDCDISKN